MTANQQTTVLIVGGGPVGMLLAAELAQQGVDTVVIEPNPGPVAVPRASLVHARTVQSLLRRGYLQPTHRGSLHTHDTTGFHFGGLPILQISAPTAEGGAALNESQQALERTFEARARGLGADIRRGQRVERLRAHEAHVSAEVLVDGDQYTLTADYAVGCDGARSTVREQVGITSTSTQPTFTALLGLVRLLDPYSVPQGWTHRPAGVTLINVNPGGLSRVITHDFTRPLPSRHEPPTLAALQATAERILGRPVPMDRPMHLSRLSDFSRLADTYRAGPVLLAGDAAHVHVPMGGQGLNTGLQDAFNLGWKLALVARGDAPEELLDSYTAERRPVAQTVIENTRAQSALMRPGPEQDRLTAQFTQPAVRRKLADEISGQFVTYPDADATSALQGTFLPNHLFGTEQGPRSTAELLVPGRPLLLLTQEADADLEHTASGWADRLTVVRVKPDEPLPWTALVCRPDGYAAWAATGPGESCACLAAALTRWLGPAGSGTGATA